MTTTRLDITIDQGADYDGYFTIPGANGSPMELTGYAAALQVKYAPDYPYAILTLTTANGGLVIDGPGGTVTPVIPAAVTTTLNPSRYVYDLKLVSPTGKHTRAYEGAAYVTAEVTDEDVTPTVLPDALLLEGGGYLLLENGGRILLDEGAVLPGPAILLEDGTYLLLETGEHLLLEDGTMLSSSAILLESGGYLLNETGGQLSLEAQ